MGTASGLEFSPRESLRDHVLSPVATAERRVNDEHSELIAERHGYERFKDRLRGIETVTQTESRAGPSTRTYVASQSRPIECIRSAFRETVMSVDHFEEVYGESLDEHVATELSPEVTALLENPQATTFTEQAKTVLLTAVQRAINERHLFIEILEWEQESLTESRRTLTDLLAEQDGPRVPEWYRSEFETTLDELAARRQETLQERPTTARMNGHDLCTYLYQREDWTYPVLTALARFRRTVM